MILNTGSCKGAKSKWTLVMGMASYGTKIVGHGAEHVPAGAGPVVDVAFGMGM